MVKVDFDQTIVRGNTDYSLDVPDAAKTIRSFADVARSVFESAAFLESPMTLTVTLLIAALIFVVAVLYSTVGHAGASGYLAAMALFGLAPAVMKPTALTLNIIVATVGTIRFLRAGFFSWRTFWPFAVASIPAAFLGGWLTLPAVVYKAIVGIVLLYSAVRIFFSARGGDDQPTRKPPIAIALLLGAAIGLLS